MAVEERGTLSRAQSARIVVYRMTAQPSCRGVGAGFEVLQAPGLFRGNPADTNKYRGGGEPAR